MLKFIRLFFNKFKFHQTYLGRWSNVGSDKKYEHCITNFSPQKKYSTGYDCSIEFGLDNFNKKL